MSDGEEQGTHSEASLLGDSRQETCSFLSETPPAGAGPGQLSAELSVVKEHLRDLGDAETLPQQERELHRGFYGATSFSCSSQSLAKGSAFCRPRKRLQRHEMHRPLRWGKYVMMFVYDAVDGDVGKELRKKNPDPHFLQNHHQWLKKFGRDKVHDQITTVVTIMKLCENMDDFRQKFARLFKKSTPQMEFTFAR